MQIVTANVIRELNNAQKGKTRISIFMSMATKGQEVRQNPIKLKSVIERIEKQLSSEELHEGKLMENLKKARSLVDDNDFWSHQLPGLALFISAESLLPVKSEVAFTDFEYINNVYYTKPLYESLASDQNYYLLDFSHNHVRVFGYSRHRLSEVEVTDMPESIESITDFKEVSKSIQGHTANSSGAMQYHGNDSAERLQDDYFLQFLQKVDEAIGNYFGHKIQVILSATEENITKFRNTTKHTLPTAEGITGSNERLTESELFPKAKQIVQTQIDEQINALNTKIADSIITGRSSSDIADVISKAFAGAIDTLIISKEDYVYGEYDQDKLELTLHEEREPGSEELLNLIASKVLATDGRVILREKENIPYEKSVAALFRY